MIDGTMRLRVSMIEHAVTRPHQTGARRADPIVLHHGGVLAPLPEHTEGGHIVGLLIGGEDHPFNLVPMYRNFNQIIYKGIETKIRNDRTITEIKIIIAYRAIPATLPSQFRIMVKRGAGPAFECLANLPMMADPQPIRYAFPDEEGAMRLLGDAQLEMRNANWMLENESSVYHGRLPDGERNYAVLDYLYLRDHDNYARLRTHLGASIGEFSISLGQSFSSEQTDIIRRINALANGLVRSDLSATILLSGSASHAPQIDHIIPKNGRSGPNAFSNAQVAGAHENAAKGNSPPQ